MESKHLSIFIPASILAETKDLKLRTYKIGLIGRSAALFRIDRIVIYSDNSNREEVKFISDVLTYMNTQAILIKTKCKKCGEIHEIIIPTQEINNYLTKEELIIPREIENN